MAPALTAALPSPLLCTPTSDSFSSQMLSVFTPAPGVPFINIFLIHNYVKDLKGINMLNGLSLNNECSTTQLFRYKDLRPNRCGTRFHSTNFACNVQGKSFPQVTAVSSLFKGDQAGRSVTIPTVSRRRKSMICRQAYIYHSSGFRIPSTAEKPEWWWRTLSCIPYLISLKMSDTGFYIQPFVENFKCFEDLVYYIPGAVNRLPSWFPMIYCYLAVVVVVKNREWPLFFRFHVMMGILLEIALQVIWYSSNFMPLVHFNGTFGMYYWAGVALAYVLIMMECVRCALLGTFVKIPLVSESAFLHSLFHLGGFQRPF